jgi:hypothetical protein
MVRVILPGSRVRFGCALGLGNLWQIVGVKSRGQLTQFLFGPVLQVANGGLSKKASFRTKMILPASRTD